MSLGVEMLLPSDCLNINGFRAIHMNTHSDATWIFIRTELLPKEFLAIRRAISLNETFVLFC